IRESMNPRPQGPAFVWRPTFAAGAQDLILAASVRRSLRCWSRSTETAASTTPRRAATCGSTRSPTASATPQTSRLSTPTPTPAPPAPARGADTYLRGPARPPGSPCSPPWGRVPGGGRPPGGVPGALRELGPGDVPAGAVGAGGPLHPLPRAARLPFPAGPG